MAFSLFTVTVSAQAKFGYGVKVGANMSNFIDKGKDVSSNMRCGVNAGFFADARLSNTFAIQWELLYSQQGARDITFRDGINHGIEPFDLNLNYFNVPVLAKFYIVDGLNLFVCPQMNIPIYKKVKSGNLDDESVSILKNSVNSMNFSVLAGVSYEFDFGLVLDARYNVGLTPTFHEFEGKRIITGSNGWLQIGVGWKF